VRRLDSLRMVLAVFSGLLLVLVLAPVATADPSWGAFASVCSPFFGTPPTCSDTAGGFGFRAAAATSPTGQSSFDALALVLLAGSHNPGDPPEIKLLTISRSGGDDPVANGTMIDFLVVKGAPGTPVLVGDVHVSIQGTISGPASIQAAIFQPAGQPSFCQDSFFPGFPLASGPVSVGLDCVYSVQPNRFFSDHVEFHLPIEVQVRALAAPGGEANFTDTAVVSVSSVTPGVTFDWLSVEESAVPAVPEAASIVLLGSGLAGPVACGGGTAGPVVKSTQTKALKCGGTIPMLLRALGPLFDQRMSTAPRGRWASTMSRPLRGRY